MVFLMMNAWCSKHVEDTKKWNSNARNEPRESTTLLFTKRHLVPSYKRFESFKELHSPQVSIHKRFIRVKQ
jgi:hypothetical protein